MKRNKKGFTIVELVIVIGVIGILSAILIPTFANLTQKAKVAEVKSNLANAYSAYIADLPEGDVPLAQTKVIFAEQEDALQDSKVTGHVYTVDEGWHYEVSTDAAANDGVAGIHVGNFWLYELA